MRDNQSLIRRRLASFGYAVHGLTLLLKTQFHAWVHLLATACVLSLGAYCSLDSTQWALIALAVGLVWTAEAINTAIEFTVDLASPQHHKLAGRAKDVAAASVLIAAATSVVVGALVFVPKLWPTS